MVMGVALGPGREGKVVDDLVDEVGGATAVGARAVVMAVVD